MTGSFLLHSLKKISKVEKCMAFDIFVCLASRKFIIFIFAINAQKGVFVICWKEKSKWEIRWYVFLSKGPSMLKSPLFWNH